MKPNCSLPVILVSAFDKETADEFISELIDNEVSETDSEKTGSSEASGGRVWRLVNKYYSVDVLLRARGDFDPPLGENARFEAHVTYLTPEECSTEERAETYAELRAAGVKGAAVRVAALRTARDMLGEWAARARCEPVPLLLADGGLQRVRDALHAHVWPGLRRVDGAAPTLPFLDSNDSSSGGEEEVDEGDEWDVERSEQFALALGALGGLGGGWRRAGGAGDAGLSDAERRERAEQAMAAFCRALGYRLDG